MLAHFTKVTRKLDINLYFISNDNHISTADFYYLTAMYCSLVNDQSMSRLVTAADDITHQVLTASSGQCVPRIRQDVSHT